MDILLLLLLSAKLSKLKTTKNKMKLIKPDNDDENLHTISSTVFQQFDNFTSNAT